jgi:hypothetical protein
MKRIISAVLVAGCLSVGAPSALAATPAASAPGAATVCTLGSTSVSVASLTRAGLSPRAARQVMNLVIATATRYRGLGMSCTTPSAPPPSSGPPVITS